MGKRKRAAQKWLKAMDESTTSKANAKDKDSMVDNDIQIGGKDIKMPKRPANPFSLFQDEFKEEFDKNDSKRRASIAARERWKLLSDSDKAPYVLKVQKLKEKVETDIEDEFKESDKSVGDKTEFDKSESDKSVFDKSEPDKLKFVELQYKVTDEHEKGSKSGMKRVEDGIEEEFEESDKFEFDKSEPDKSKFDGKESDKLVSVKSECEVTDEQEERNKSKEVNDDSIKKETEEDELQSIIKDFARFEEAFTPQPKAINLHMLLDELEKLFSLPLETLFQSANLIQLQNILKEVKDLPLLDAKLGQWCEEFLKIALDMPKKRVDIKDMLMEAEAEAEELIQYQKEAVDIRKKTLEDQQLKVECSTSIQDVDSNIENLKRQLLEAEAQRAALLQLEGDLEVGKYQRLKRARTVRDHLRPLIAKNAGINKLILDSKIAIKNIDSTFNALIVQFNVLKSAAN